MKELNKFTYTILLLFLFSPLIAIIYPHLPLPKDVDFFFRLIFWSYGFIFIFLANINKQKLVIPKAVYYLAAYILFLFIWNFGNGNLERRGLVNIIVNNVHLTTIFSIIIIYSTRFSDQFIKYSLKIIKITIFIAALLSLVQVINPNFMKAIYYEGFNLKGYSLYEVRRTSIFGYAPNALDFSYIPLLSIFIGVYSFSKKKMLFFFLFLGSITAMLSNSRSIIIGFIILSLQLFITYKIKMKGIFRYLVIIIPIIIIVLYLLSYLHYDILDWYNVRLFAEGSIQETTRYKAIDNFLIFFPDVMWFGNGVGMTDAIKSASASVGSSQIHVGYLSHLVYWGLVGSFFLFGFWYQLAKKLYKTAKRTNYWGSFFAFLTFLWANATLVHFSIFHYGLIFAFVFDKYYQDKYIVENNKNYIGVPFEK